MGLTDPLGALMWDSHYVEYPSLEHDLNMPVGVSYVERFVSPSCFERLILTLPREKHMCKDPYL